MPRVRIEWVPVQMYGLGRLGFDHLQLVFEPGESGRSAQDDWFVMEGVRDATSDGAYLGIEGADGRTTLATANLAARPEQLDALYPAGPIHPRTIEADAADLEALYGAAIAARSERAR